MNENLSPSRFQQVLETVESLPPDDQELLLRLVQEHLIQSRRSVLAKEIRETRAAYHAGRAKRGTAHAFWRDLGE